MNKVPTSPRNINPLSDQYYPIDKNPDWIIPSGLPQITEIQPQIAQIELLFNGPLIKDSVVEKLEDLTTLKSKYHYQHKLVWVKEYACHYYLDNGDGSNIINWKRAIGRLVVSKWDKDDVYQAGDCVMLAGKMYFALKDVPAGINPTSNEIYWQVCVGEIETYRYIFQNISSIIIYTEIRNPIFEVIVGTPQYDAEGEPILNPETGLIELTDKEIVEACVIQREDLIPEDGSLLPNDRGGIPYEISFYEDEKLKVMKSGCINVK